MQIALVGGVLFLAILGWGAKILIAPGTFRVNISQFSLCDRVTLDSYKNHPLTRDDFREERVYICGHLKNELPFKPAHLLFVLSRADEPAIWDYRKSFYAEESDFFIPVTEAVPGLGRYQMRISDGKYTLYQIQFYVSP